MKYLILLFFITIPTTYALDESRFINELDYLRDSVSKVKEDVSVTESSTMAKASEVPKTEEVDKTEIINLENQYFSDEISSGRAAPKRSR